MAVTLAQVFQAFGATYLAAHGVSAPQARVWRAVIDCRTARLGGHCLECDACGRRDYLYHSCRNRHCPQCQTRAKEAWTRRRLTELLPVPYAHLVFTLPHALNPLATVHGRWVYETLLGAVAHTLSAFAQNHRWLGAEPAFTLVLHTWTQDLRRHVHVHAVMACGGLDAEGNWVTPQRKPRFLFPVHALSRVFRRKFLNALDSAHRRQRIPRDPAAEPAAWSKRRRALLQHDWVVYAKTPLGGAAEVLEYLSRYTHRTAISSERIVAIRDEQVLLRVRANAHGGKRVVRMPGTAFLGRFLQHVLPPGFKRIRHYGLLASARKAKRLSAARQALNAPLPNPLAQESAEQFMRRVAERDISRCPLCAQGTLRVVALLPPERSAAHRPSPAPAYPSACRGPP